MCGIAGLFLKDPSLEPELGRLTSEMLVVLSDRGPDSAGFAVYGQAEPERVKFTLRVAAGTDRGTLLERLRGALGADATLLLRDDHVVVSMRQSINAGAVDDGLRGMLVAQFPELALVGSGSRMELYKGVGRPAAVSARFGLPLMSGSHAIGHTRMATESAVTIAGAHPFSTGADQCLVHNGSLSNHNQVRRMLCHEGLAFETANDSEVAAGYLSWRMSQGAGLGDALQSALGELDGFYTFVVGTASGFGVLRDPVACKPAVLAETDRYVAFASEYRALVDLPGIEGAHIFEPEPARVYFWERAA